MRKAVRIVTTLLYFSMILSACGRSNSLESMDSNQHKDKGKKAQNVTMFTTQSKYYDSYKKIRDKLKAEENITLDIQLLPVDQYFKLINTKIAAREMPDLITANVPDRYEELDAKKNMVNLSSEPWVGRLSNPGILKASDGNVYAKPITSSSFYAAAYYNKKVFTGLGLTEPKTYAEFLGLLETIKTKGNGITPIYMSNKDTWTTQIFMTAGLPVLLGDKAQQTWDKLLTNQLKWTEVPEFRTILNLYLGLYKKGYVNKDHVTATLDDAKAALAAGKAAMIYNGEWTVGDLVTKYNMRPEDIGAFVIPFGDRDVMATGSFVEGWLIPKDAKNIEGARKVLDLLSQPAYLDIYFADNPSLPGFKDINGGEIAPAVKGLEEKYIKGNKCIYEMNASMGFLNGLFIDQLWGSYVDMAVGEKTPEQVIESWQSKYSEFMKQRNQLGF